MNRATLSWISGPVLRARSDAPFQVNEAVSVGGRKLLGEVIQLRGEEIVVQVYEDTTGLRPGDAVEGSGAALSVRLGPDLLGNIFDGLLRPLADSGDFIEPGALPQRSRTFPFHPLLAVGDVLHRGTAFGRVESAGERARRCLALPDVEGRVLEIATPGVYDLETIVCRVETPRAGVAEVALAHRWPVRRPRPASRRLPASRPLLTGQRVLDTLFPVARGGRAALPGGFGTGKTVLQQTLAKWSDADVVVYVGCGERGNEMAEVLQELPLLDDPRSGRRLLERTVIIANTSNMPVAAREASIYTGVTVAEYFRDQGLHVALMADSTSRWAEALREISGRLGELPAESGYPAYLTSRLAEFYERAGRVETLGGDEGSLTLIGAISPPGGDFSEPVTKHTQRYVRCMWALDPERAHARVYPAIHPLTSYSEDIDVLSAWWEREGDPRFVDHRRRMLELLEDQAKLERMARIIGKDALSERQQLVLLSAELAHDAFLRQSALSPVDAHCSPARQAKMLRLVVHFAELAEAAVSAGTPLEAVAALPVLARLRRMSEEIPDDHVERLDALAQELDDAFSALGREVADAS
jgi:V/A-type H+/Na+-transporting ATPase subunit A